MDVLEISENYRIDHFKQGNVIAMRFIGDMSDEVYKTMWNRSLHFSETLQVNRFIIDQSRIGKVSFSARGWVVIKVFPTLKKILPGDVNAAVLTSSNLAHKSGMAFLAKAFQKLSGYQVDFFSEEAEALTWLKES